jgi:hypothetical protein
MLSKDRLIFYQQIIDIDKIMRIFTPRINLIY